MDFQKMLKMSKDINEMCTELKLLNPDGLTEFKFNKIQQKILANINEHNITNAYASRQSGVTTLIALHALHHALFNSNKHIIFLTPKMDYAYEICDRIRFFFNQLNTKLLGINLVVDTKGRLEFSNSTCITFSSAKSSTIRGKTASILYLDCLDYLDKKDFDDFITHVYPTLSYNSKIISVNTGCLNGYFKNWQYNINLPYTENDVDYINRVEEVIKKQVMDNSRINREYLLI